MSDVVTLVAVVLPVALCLVAVAAALDRLLGGRTAADPPAVSTLGRVRSTTETESLDREGRGNQSLTRGGESLEA